MLRHDEPSPVPWQPFDEAAASYDRWFESPLGSFADRVERRALFGLLAPEPGEVILDVGCGTGRYVRELAHRGVRAIGADPSAAMLTMAARAPIDEASYVRAAGEALPLRSGAFDGVVIVTTLEFATNPNALLSEAVRVTRARGRIVIGVLSSRGPWAARRKRSRSPLWASARLFTEDELRAMLGRYGPVESRRALFVPPQFGWAPPPLMSLVERLGSMFAGRRAAFIAVRVDVGR